MKRLAILSTHPIQYNAPLFRLLAADEAIELKVFYSKKSEEVRFDKDFGREIIWDVPLTQGYVHESFGASARNGRKQMVRAIEEFNPNALLVYGWNFPGHWATMRHFKGRAPVWFRGDSTLLDPLPFWKKVMRKLLLNLVYRSVDRAFYVGQANKRYFIWAGLQEKQLTYAPHAVDNDYFIRDDEERMKLAVAKRKELGIEPDATVFLFVGKLEAKKQPEMLGRAFLRLKSTNAHLIYIGSGAMEKDLKSEFRVSSNIHFIGFQNQQSMPVWYRVGNVLCLPSAGPGETWGLAVNEAMACGCTAIVSDRVGCGEDLIVRRLGSFVVPFDQLPSWVAILNELARQGQEARDITEIKRFVNTRFNFRNMITAIKSQLQDVQAT